jgi:hypothetical protein
MTDLPFTLPADDPTRPARPSRKCYRHMYVRLLSTEHGPTWVCETCGKARDDTASKRGRGNRSRGNRDELVVARILGGNKLGQLGLPWDVEIPGYLRVQAKKLDRWPSLNAVIEWLDGIPSSPELRAVTLADTPGPGGRTRRLIVMDLEEFASFHGRATR